MKLEDQVTNLELSKKLKELGVKQESLFYWIPNKNKKMVILPVVHDSLVMYENGYSAFTVAELGEMFQDCYKNDKYWKLPWSIKDFYSFKWCSEVDNRGSHIEADARAILLIYLIENKLIKI